MRAFKPYLPSEASKILRGKTYEDVFALPNEELRKLALAFPHPGHEKPSRVKLNDGRTVFLRRVSLTPHVHLKPNGIALSAWLANLSDDERLGHELHLQHKKMLVDSFPLKERVYGAAKDQLVDHLLDRLPERHPLRVGHETVIAALDAKNNLLGFVTGLTTRRKSALIGYACVKQEYGGTGLSKFLGARLLHELAGQGARVVLGEVEPFGEKEAAKRAKLLLLKQRASGLSERQAARLAELTRARARMRLLSTHGALIVKGVPYFVPVFDGSRRVLPMTLVATVLQRNARGGVSLNRGGALSLRDLKRAVLDIHSSPYIYVSNCHSLPVLRGVFERLERSGVKSFPLVRFSKAA